MPGGNAAWVDFRGFHHAQAPNNRRRVESHLLPAAAVEAGQDQVRKQRESREAQRHRAEDNAQWR